MVWLVDYGVGQCARPKCTHWYVKDQNNPRHQGIWTAMLCQSSVTVYRKNLWKRHQSYIFRKWLLVTLTGSRYLPCYKDGPVTFARFRGHWECLGFLPGRPLGQHLNSSLFTNLREKVYLSTPVTDLHWPLIMVWFTAILEHNVYLFATLGVMQNIAIS